MKTINNLVLVITLLFATFSVFAQKTGKSGDILFITRMEDRFTDYNDAVKSYLDEQGYTVTMVDQSEPLTRSNSMDLVIIASTISARSFEDKYTDVAIPVLTWENDLQDDMHFTGRQRNVDYGEMSEDGLPEHNIWLVNAPHPLSAGLEAGNQVPYNKDQFLGWGKPGLGATIIATLPGVPNKVILYGYEKGATMYDDFLAPARRVMFALNNSTFPDLNEKGLALFDAAVTWTMGK